MEGGVETEGSHAVEGGDCVGKLGAGEVDFNKGAKKRGIKVGF